jgi:CRP/FNR family transcriptional regulator, cyclic AMP receptor protein
MNELVEALKRQRMVAGNTELAERIAAIGARVEVPAGTAIIQEGDDDNEVYLIVAGSFHIVVNGKTIGQRTATDHVGEMAAILPVQRRAASVIAHEPSVAVKLSNAQVNELGERYPEIWRCFARELAHRLHQRNLAATAVNDRVSVFIIAPPAAGEIAQTVKSAFGNESFDVAIWTDEAFRNYDVDSLEGMLDRSDVAITVVGSSEARDEIIFELGFLMGRLGRHRTFLIEAHNEEVQLPAELAGINTVTYRLATGDGQDLGHALAPACDKLRKLIRELGPNR